MTTLPDWKLTRRGLLKTGLGGAALAMSRATKAVAQAPTVMTSPGKLLPDAKGPRVVVCGGGWAGLAAAKSLKQENAKIDVVLIEQRPLFMSCPISNLWLADLVKLEFLMHDYLQPAALYGYHFVNATILGVDRAKKRVETNAGSVNYDFLVLAPGIDYNYAAYGITDPADVEYVMTRYPAAFKPGSEHFALKRKIWSFKGGTFVITVPPGNYRCLPAPYERACLIAYLFKKRKVKGKVVIVDHNPDVTIKAKGFHAAWDDLYKGYVEYVPSRTIEKVDFGKKKIITNVDEVDFTDANIYPRIKAAKLIELAGVVDPKSPQGEAQMDGIYHNVIGDSAVYVAGDARSMPFSKSGNTANSEAKIVAKIIAARIAGKDLQNPDLPHTICYSVVNGNPMEAIMVDAGYAYDAAKKEFGFANVKMTNERSPSLGATALEWARGLYRDMFGA